MFFYSLSKFLQSMIHTQIQTNPENVLFQLPNYSNPLRVINLKNKIFSDSYEFSYSKTL